MTKQAPATAEIEKWLQIRVRFFLNIWHRIRVRKKNAESCLSRLQYAGSDPTSDSKFAIGYLKTAFKPEPDTKIDIWNAFLDILRIQNVVLRKCV